MKNVSKKIKLSYVANSIIGWHPKKTQTQNAIGGLRKTIVDVL